MADNVEVKLGADTTQASAAFDDASVKIRASLADIGARINGLKDNSQEMVSSVTKSTKQTAQGFEKMQSDISNQLGSTKNALTEFKGSLAATAAAITAGFASNFAIKSMLDLEDSVRGLEIAFGVTADKATQMSLALKLAGISSDTYEQMGQRVGRVLKTQSDEFDRLKVVTKDASGNLLPMDDILQNIYKRMQDFKAGTDQTEFALSTVGRNAKDFASDMQRLSTTQERATELQQQFNIEMGPDRQNQIEAYRVETNAFKIVLDELGTKVGEQLLPNLMALSQWFSSYATPAITAVVSLVKLFAMALEALRGIVTIIAGPLMTVVNVVWDLSKAIAGSIQAIGHLDLTEFLDVWKFHLNEAYDDAKDTFAKVADEYAKTIDKMDKLWNPAKFGAELQAQLSEFPDQVSRALNKSGAPIPGSGTEHFTPKPKGGTGADKSRIGEWDAELKAERDAYEQMKLDQGSFERWSEDQTAAYWERIKASNTLSTKEAAQVNSKFYDAERAVRTQDFQALVADLERQKAAMGTNYDERIRIAQREAAIIAQAYGTQSKEAEAAYAKVAEEQRKLAAQTEKLADIESQLNEARANHDVAMEKLAIDQKVALRQINTQQQLAAEKDLEDKLFQIKQTAIQAQIAAEAEGPDDPVKIAALNAKLEELELSHQEKITAIDNAAERDRMQTALQVESAIEGGFSTLFSDLMSGTKSWKDAFLDAAKQIEKAIDDIVAKKLAEALFGAGSSGGNALGSIIGSLFGGGGVPSFDVGTPYVPRDTLALVHQGERIVPAAQNRASGGMAVQNHFHISGPVDSRTQDQIALAAARGTQRGAYRIG